MENVFIANHSRSVDGDDVQRRRRGEDGGLPNSLDPPPFYEDPSPIGPVCVCVWGGGVHRRAQRRDRSSSATHSPRRCCWTPAASRAATSWVTCRPGWAGATRRATRTRRRRPTTVRCCDRRPPSSAAVCPARRRLRRPRPSSATRDRRPAERRCCRSGCPTWDLTDTGIGANKQNNRLLITLPVNTKRHDTRVYTFYEIVLLFKIKNGVVLFEFQFA